MYQLASSYRAEYNNLSLVETADDFVRGNGNLQSLLLSAERMFIDADVTDIFGVRLLHKHNDIAEGELMLEDLEVLSDGRPALATVRTAAWHGRSFTPSIWRCLPDGGTVALEFCDAALRPASPHLFDEHRELFAAFHRLSVRHGLDKVLGLCLRSGALQPQDDEMLVEVVDGRRDANVLAIEKRTGLDMGQLIETIWEFSMDTTSVCKKSFCSATCRKTGSSHTVYHGGVHGEG